MLFFSLEYIKKQFPCGDNTSNKTNMYTYNLADKKKVHKIFSLGFLFLFFIPNNNSNARKKKYSSVVFFLVRFDSIFLVLQLIGNIARDEFLYLHILRKQSMQIDTFPFVTILRF